MLSVYIFIAKRYNTVAIFDVFDIFLYTELYCKYFLWAGWLVRGSLEPFYILLTKFEKNYLTLVSLL